MSERGSRKSPIIPIIVAALAAVALIASLSGVFAGSSKDDQESAEGVDRSSDSSAAEELSEAPFARRDADDPMAKGDVDAPVVMIAYSEFQCPFCGKFARDTAPVLEEKYVEDGTLRIEWRDFPYLGKESVTAAVAGRSAAEQNTFWEFHDAMFDDQLPPNSGGLDQAYVEGIAEDVGLDLEQFREDMKAASTDELVAADFREGQSLGVTGTPSFLINDQIVVGAQPTEVFEEIIEEAAGR